MVNRVDGLRCKYGRSLVASGRTVLLQRESRIGTARRTISVVHPLRFHTPPWSACGVLAAYGRYGAIYLRALGGQQNYPTTKTLGTRRRVMSKTFRYVPQVVYPCVCNWELSGRRAEAIF